MYINKLSVNLIKWCAFEMIKKIFLLLSAILFFAALLGSGCEKHDRKQKLIMVTDATFPPYEMRSGNKVVGIDPEIVGEIARRNGFELVIEDMNFESIITAIQTGKADVAASGITVTEERKKMVDFTRSYVVARQVVIVRNESNITGIEQLKGRKLGVQHGTVGDLYVTKNIQEPERYSSSALTVAALVAKKVEAVVLDDAPAAVFCSVNRGIKILPKPLTEENYAFAINKKRTELLKIFNDTLKEMEKDGSLKAILDKYFNENKKVNKEEKAVAVSGSLWKKCRDAFITNFVDDSRYLYLLRGFFITLQISAGAVMIGIILGFFVAVIRSTADQTGKLKITNALCKIYLTVIRGTPVVVQLLIIYFVIFGSLNVNKVLVATLAFGLNSGAYVAEIIRSGIMSIDRGQLEAGRSLGMSYPKTMFWIILPQALKNVLPALGNEFIVLLKETSVSGYIALQDLTKGGDIIRSQTYNAFMPLLAVAVIYLAVVMLFAKLLAVLEKRLKKNE